MKLLESVRFDITEYCGNLIVTYLSDDKAMVADLLSTLDSLGYEYVINEVGRHSVMKNSYIDDIQEKLTECGCYLLFLSASFDKPENRALRNNIWYQVGMLQARRDGIVVPFMNSESKCDLSKSPLQPNKIIDSSKIVTTFRENFRSVIARNEYFADDELNNYTRDRIEYRRLEIALDVTPKSFAKAKKLYLSAVSNDVSDDDFISALRDNMTCGARLVSFGSNDRLTTNLLPYRDEINTVYDKDYPESFTCKQVFVKGDRRDGLMGQYKLEIILPIHKLLGVNFKSFVRAHGELTVDILKALFEPNFTKQTDLAIIKDTKTLYFCIPVYPEEKFPLRKELQDVIGKYSDYVYPQ